MKNSGRAAPTNKQGRFCRRWCPELIQIQGFLCLRTLQEYGARNPTHCWKPLELHTALPWRSRQICNGGGTAFLQTLKITAGVGKVHPCWRIFAQGYKNHSSFCSPSPKISSTGCFINTRARGACRSSGCILWLDSLQSRKARPLPGGFLITQDTYSISLAISLCLPILQRGVWAFHWNFWSWPTIILLAKFPVKWTFIRQLTLRQSQEALKGTWLELTAKSRQV